MARIAEDEDFLQLRELIDNSNGWSLEISKEDTKVWTMPVDGCALKMVKINSIFDTVDGFTLFDVLHDPDYRKVWDSHMLDSHEIGVFNVNNDVGYYAMSCPPPLKPRDFVLQRSWLDTGPEQMLISRSVYHREYPPRKGYVRAQSHITGFIIRPHPSLKYGCSLGYVAHCDPQGKLPSWLVNKVTHTLGPRMINDLKKAALGYIEWKNTQPHLRKPWRFPEQITTARVSVEDTCFQVTRVLPVPPLSREPSSNSLVAVNISNNGTNIKEKKKMFRFKREPMQGSSKNYSTL